ncbi:carbohydrate ABC transporter substrate-binding protein [Alicyclobacillus curvatus]|nr:carbohydrate ABC transporter substrate-binding protein [Alicyclobacillus curvatus]
MKKRLGLGLGGVLVVTGMLSGCGSAASGGNTSASSGGKTTITYWSMWNPGEPQQVVLQDEINAFEKSHPNIQVQVEWDGRQVLNKVERAISAGNPPDLTDQSGGETTGALIAKNLATPIDQLLQQDAYGSSKPLKDSFLGTTIDQYKFNGHYYFMPYEFITGGIWYNKVLFNKYNLQPPTTWSQLVSLTQQLKSHGVSPIALDGQDSSYAAYWYNWLAARVAGPDALLKAASDPSGKAWSNPKLLQAAQMEEQLIQAGDFEPGYQGSVYPAAQTAWAQGKSGMILLMDWITSETQKYAGSNFQYAMTPFPQVGSGKTTDMPSYLEGFVIPKNAPHLKATETFLNWLMTPKHLQGISTKALNFTDLKGDPTPSTLTSIEPTLKQATSFYDPHGGVYAKASGWTSSVYFPTNEEFIGGKLTPQQFITTLQQSTVQYLKAHNNSPE